MSRSYQGGHRSRKKLSLDGSVPGIEYNRHHGGYNRSPFDGQLHIDRPHPQQVYDPDPGRPDFPEPLYEQYQCDMPHHQTPPLRFELPEIEIPAAKCPPNYNDCLITEDSFQQAMRECIGELPPEPIPADHDVRATGIMVGPGFLDDVVDDALRDDPVQEMASALEQQMEAQFAEPQPEPMPQQMYEEEWQQFMNPFGMPGMGPFGPMGPMM